MRRLAAWLSHHWTVKYPLMHPKQWTTVNLAEVPEQKNGCDCGVYTCMFADFLSGDQTMSFDDSATPMMRKIIALNLLRYRVSDN